MKDADSRTKFEFSRYVSTYLQEQIKLADTKAAWTFSFLGIGTAALTTKIAKIDWASVNLPLTMLFIGISIALLILAFKSTVRVIYPRLSKGNPNGMIYFEDISSQDKKNYIKKSLSITDEEITKEMVEQSYNLSSVASRKFKALRSAIIVAVITLIWIISLLIII